MRHRYKTGREVNMKRLKAINFVMMLVLLLQTLVIPLNVTQAASQDEQGPQVTSEVILDESMGGETEYATQTPIKILSSVNVNEGYNLEQGTIQIALAKKYFQAVDPQKDITLTGKQFLDSADVTSDDQNYYINYHLDTIASGGNISIPSTIYFKSPNINLDVATITQTILNKNGEVLYTATKDLTVLTDWRGQVKNFASSQYDRHKYSASEINSDKTTNVAVDESFQFAYTRNMEDDSRDIIATMTFPEDDSITFREVADSGWSYDAQTRVATKVIKATKQDQYFIIPIHIKAGVQIGSSVKLPAQISRVGRKDSERLLGSYILSYHFDENEEIFSPSSTINLLLSTGGSLSYSHIDEILNQEEVYTKARPVNNIKDDRTILVRSFKITSSLSGSSNGTVAHLNLDRTGARLSMDEGQKLPQGADHNTLIGVRADGTKVTLATNLSTERIHFSNEDISVYQSFELIFADPIAITQDNQTFYLKVFGQVEATSLQDFVQADIEKASLHDEINVDFPDYEGTRGDYISADIYKWIPSLRGDLKLDSDNLLSGTTSSLTAEVSTYQFPQDNQFSPRGAKIVFLLPNGVELDDSDDQAIQNLTDVQVYPNYQGSGKTAVTGIPTVSMTEPYGHYYFSIPITASSSLRYRPDYQAESYFVYQNNNGTYANYTSDSLRQILSDDIEDPFHLYKDTDNPKKGFYRTTTFSYSPPRGLISSKLVKDENSVDFVEDTGTSADAGSKLTYRLNLFNNGLADVKKVGLIDVLPTQGDQNDSEFSIHLTDKMTIDNADYQDKFTVFYSTDQPSGDRSTDYEQANWEQELPSDPSQVTMVKAELNDGETLKVGDTINFDFAAQIPDDLEIPDGATSYNVLNTTQNGGGSFVTSPKATTSVNYKTSYVQVTKVSAQDVQKVLPDAQYQLYDYDTDQRLNDDVTYTTDDKGQFTITDLKPGHYYMKEIAAPDGYLLPEDQATEKETTQFTIVRNQAEPTEVTYTNTPERSLLINKIDAQTKDPLSGAHFKLSTADGTVIDADLVTDDQGQVHVYQLEAGQYTLTETQAPAGYQLSTTPTVIDVATDSGLVTQTITNQALPGNVIVKYVDSDENELAPSKTLHGLIDSEYDTHDQRLVIDGYTLDLAQLPSNEIGRFTKDDQVVTYVYREDTPDEDDNDEPITPPEDGDDETNRPSTPPNDDQPVKPKLEQTVQSKIPKAKSQRKLPQTSESMEYHLLSLIGLVIFGVCGFVVSRHYREV